MSGEEDMFDEDLVRELGLDPEDLNGPKMKKKRREPAAPPPKAAAPKKAPAPRAKPPRPAAPKAAAPKPPVEVAFEYFSKI